MSRRRASATMASKAASSPRSGCRAVWPPSTPADGPGAAGVVGTGLGAVVATLAVGDPDGVDRREVDDVEAQLGQGRAAGPARRRSRPRSGGTSRTRTPNAPRTGSTSTSTTGSRRATRERSGWRSAAATTSAPRAAATRARSGRGGVAGGRPPRPGARRRRRGRGPRSARSAAAASSRAPSDSSPPRSACAAATLRSTSTRQEARSSAQASTVQAQRPGRSTVKAPSQRTPFTSASTWRSGEPADHSASPGPLQRTTARRTSWPSRKMSAPTSTVRPTVALDG